MQYRDSMLDVLGRRRRSAGSAQLLPMLGVFGAGLLIGMGVALLVAPTSGVQARNVLANNGRRLAKGLRRRAPNEFDRIETAGHRVAERLGDLPNGVSKS